MEIPSTCSEIPAALRRARRKEHAQHPHSERAFKGIKSVPIGRASDVFEYEVPASPTRRCINMDELYVPWQHGRSRWRWGKYAALAVAVVAVWTALAMLETT